MSMSSRKEYTFMESNDYTRCGFCNDNLKLIHRMAKNDQNKLINSIKNINLLRCEKCGILINLNINKSIYICYEGHSFCLCDYCSSLYIIKDNNIDDDKSRQEIILKSKKSSALVENDDNDDMESSIELVNNNYHLNNESLTDDMNDESKNNNISYSLQNINDIEMDNHSVTLTPKKTDDDLKCVSKIWEEYVSSSSSKSNKIKKNNERNLDEGINKLAKIKADIAKQIELIKSGVYSQQLLTQNGLKLNNNINV